ncbi:putative uncharacterized protein [Bacteroides sp. CAG:1060]|nr:putative uncharacterized protein [Bacteroides sp. CAG:1060]
MHKIRTALFVSAAVLLGSCTKPQGEEHGTAIGFSTSTVSQVEGTKSNHTGESTTTATLKNKPFGVYGMYSVTDGGKGTNVFDFSSPVEVRYTTEGSSTEKNWTYTFSGSQYPDKKYWKRNMYYRFRAYHPYDATLLQSSSSADGIDIEYRVLDDSYDLLLASAKRYPANDGYDRVQMVFNHALCALKFKIAFKETVTPSTYTNNIIHFYIKGLNAYGHLNYTGFGEKESFNWSGTFNSHDKLYEWTGDKEFGVKGTVEPTDILESNQYFFAIPQMCSDPANGPTSIHLYTRKSGGDNEIDHTVNLPPLEWKAGKIYTYTLLVNKSDIEVSVTIEPWLTKQVPVDIYL